MKISSLLSFVALTSCHEPRLENNPIDIGGEASRSTQSAGSSTSISPSQLKKIEDELMEMDIAISNWLTYQDFAIIRLQASGRGHIEPLDKTMGWNDILKSQSNSIDEATKAGNPSEEETKDIIEGWLTNQINAANSIRSWSGLPSITEFKRSNYKKIIEIQMIEMQELQRKRIKYERLAFGNIGLK